MSESSIGKLVDEDFEDFKCKVITKPIGECMSLKNLLSLEYSRVKSAFEELTNKAVSEGKQKDPEYVKTLQGITVVMFRIEQKVLFLNERIEDLMIS